MNERDPAPSVAPEGYSSVAPWVVTPDTAAQIDFLVAAFDGTELGRVVADDGTIGHAEVRIGDAVVLLFDRPPTWPETPALVRLYVPDAERSFRRALDAGAHPVTDPTELGWGDQVARVRDPQGNLWWIHARVTELTPEQVGERMAEPRFIEAMAYVQSMDPFTG